MQRPFPSIRIPYTGPLPPPLIIPSNANTPAGAIAALSHFLSAPSSPHLKSSSASSFSSSASAKVDGRQTVLLTGAGISVASGLADYRGVHGTYTLNKTYRPIFYNEFTMSHEARKRYWARSFLGWYNLYKAKPNDAHWAVKSLGDMGIVRSVITQNVDSFHPKAHPVLPSVELHGFLRSLVCIQCHDYLARGDFQKSLATLNPSWQEFLEEMIAAGALDTEHPDERKKKGLKTNPDGDVDLPNAPYSTFRYPACPRCLVHPPTLTDGSKARVDIDRDGAWLPSSSAGVLKPAVVMFGESISTTVKAAAEDAIDNASRILVIGSSLATYSAWRLVKRAKERNMSIGILNLGGVRGEDSFFAGLAGDNNGEGGVRCSESADKILPDLVRKLQLQGWQGSYM